MTMSVMREWEKGKREEESPGTESGKGKTGSGDGVRFRSQGVGSLPPRCGD
jgi:hypothetical protein